MNKRTAAKIKEIERRMLMSGEVRRGLRTMVNATIRGPKRHDHMAVVEAYIIVAKQRGITCNTASLLES